MRASRPILGWLLLTGCAPDLDAIHDWDDAPPTADRAPEPPPPSGATEGSATIDATDYEIWHPVDLDDAFAPSTADSPDWDLQIRRYQILVNGGVSGPAEVAAAFVEGATLQSVDVPPDDAFLADQEDSPDDDDVDPELAMADWYDYDPATHILTPREGVWVVRTTEDAHIGLRIDSYYDPVGTPAVLTLAWKRL